MMPYPQVADDTANLGIDRVIGQPYLILPGFDYSAEEASAAKLARGNVMTLQLGQQLKSLDAQNTPPERSPAFSEVLDVVDSIEFIEGWYALLAEHDVPKIMHTYPVSRYLPKRCAC